MNIGIVIIIGAVVGFVASKIRGSGFGLLWDVYLGIAGAIFASLTMIYAYFMNIMSKPFVLGMNSYSIAIGIAGALALIYIAWLYNKAGSARQIWQMKQKRQSLSILSASLRYGQTGA
jgi:uncharacterized membrane protein YeaQ/YmgE (transglycosylase-associated protein family)